MTDLISTAPGLARGAIGSPNAAAANHFRLAELDPVLDRRLDPDGGLRFSVYRSLGECEAVWRQAVADCACYAFQCFEWQSAFQATIGAAEKVAPSGSRRRSSTG